MTTKLHAHFQIMYNRLSDNQNVESLVGFDPRVEKSKKFIHACLDEYLEFLGAFMTKCEAEGIHTIKLDDRDYAFHIINYLDETKGE